MGEALIERGGRGGRDTDRRLLGHLAMAALLVAAREWRNAGPGAQAAAPRLEATLAAIPGLRNAPMSLASIDGALMPAAEATIPVTDEGLLRGDGVFEVIRLYEGPAVRLRRAPRRAWNAPRANLRLPADVDGPARRRRRGCWRRAGAVDALLRLVLTRGGRRLALIEPLPEHPPAIRLGHVTFAPTRVLDGIKSLSYAGNMLATRLAKERGADEALLVTPHGRVLEAPTSTFFWVSGGRCCTPPLGRAHTGVDHPPAAAGCAGRRRGDLHARRPGRAEEAFLASTVREVQAVAAIDDASYRRRAASRGGGATPADGASRPSWRDARLARVAGLGCRYW